MSRFAAVHLLRHPCRVPPPPSRLPIPSKETRSTSLPQSSTTTRRAVSIFTTTTFFSGLAFFSSSYSSCSWSKPTISDFVELPNSGGVKSLDLRIGDGGQSPVNGDKVVIHYYGRLAAKQGWRFDSSYDHKDGNGEPIPFEFVLGSGKVISGIESAVKTMKVGGIRRVVIPPSQGYQNTQQEPIPPNTEVIYYHFQPNSYSQWRRLNSRDTRIRY